MRIGIIASIFPARSETFVLDSVVGLLRRGHDVRVLASSPTGSVATDRADVPDEIPDRVVYRRVPAGRLQALSSGMLAGISSRPRWSVRTYSRYLATVPAEGRRFDLSEEMRGIQELGDLDLIHCHFGPIGARAADALEVLGSATPLITTFHGFDITSYLSGRNDMPYRRLFRRGSRFLAVSDYFRDVLVDLGAPPESTEVHRVGVDVERLRPNLDRGRSPDALSVLMVGRLVEKKGFEYGLRALAEASDLQLRVRASVIGDGPLHADLVKLADELRLADTVRFLGAQGRSQVLAALGESDVLLAPSIRASDGNMEGIPVVIMEAMASGVAVVTTRHSGIPELVHHGETGLLAGERDSSELSKHLTRLANDDALRNRIASQGRDFVVAHYNQAVQLDRLESLYERVLQ